MLVPLHCGGLEVHGGVSLVVQRQVVGPREASVTVLTLEGLGARVFAEVSRQLVRARESPLTAFPRAPVRFFTCNTSSKTQVKPTSS